MSDSERPDLVAFQELEQLIRALGDEMAAWRRRAQHAESRLKQLEPRGAGDQPPADEPDERVVALQRENAALVAKVDLARQRTKALLDRMRFLRQQQETGVER